MAIVTRYFSTSAAGAGDGTSWADRAALLSAGAFSTIITGFAFNGSDSLKCLIGPGTYTVTNDLAAADFTNAPSAANPLILHGCDSSGNPLTPANPGWVSAQPAWDDSGLPVLETTTNILTINLPHCFCRHLKFTASGRTGGGALNQVLLDWCSLTSSTSNTGALGMSTSGGSTRNSVIRMTGTAFDSAIFTNLDHVFLNTRLEGNASASSGNRRGFSYNASLLVALQRCTITGFVGGGFVSATSSTAQNYAITRCTLVNNGGSGVLGASAASQSEQSVVSGCMITGNGAYGIDAQSGARLVAENNRLRDNASGNLNGLGNYPVDLDNYTTDSDDASEYLDAAGGDFRIKPTAAIWGKGYGAGDQSRAGRVVGSRMLGWSGRVRAA